MKSVICVLCVFVSTPLAVAGQDVETAVFEQGQQLYEEHCALCHQNSGTGDPPAFPALSANEALADSRRIVRNIRQGAGTMPSFPHLGAGEISSVASYIRSAWTNNFGSVSTDDVAAVLEGVEEIGPMVSVWDGVFTDAQANRGQAVYEGACGMCHGRRLNGAPDDPDLRSTPPLARAAFLRNWEGRSLATLFEYMRATMPEDNPGSLTNEEYVDVITYMLTVGGMPAGGGELRADPQGLARTAIRQEP